MYKVCTKSEIIASFDTVIEAIAYCVKNHWIYQDNGITEMLEVR